MARFLSRFRLTGDESRALVLVLLLLLLGAGVRHYRQQHRLPPVPAEPPAETTRE